MLQRKFTDLHNQMALLVEAKGTERNVLTIVVLRAKKMENSVKIRCVAFSRPRLTLISRWCFRASARMIENARRMMIFTIFPLNLSQFAAFLEIKNTERGAAAMT
jgi:hypothetical protein